MEGEGVEVAVEGAETAAAAGGGRREEEEREDKAGRAQRERDVNTKVGEADECGETTKKKGQKQQQKEVE
jgi:hypothetical protein